MLQDRPIHLQGLHLSYNTLACTLHPYYPTVEPVASRSLFFDVQVLTLLLGKYTLFVVMVLSILKYLSIRAKYTDIDNAGYNINIGICDLIDEIKLYSI